jgi:quinohemoprotein ethanol dehydrogenase
MGGVLFNSTCFYCHGFNAVAGPLPDLRYSSKETLDSMEHIVLSGSRASNGMPSFSKILSPDDVKAIRAYMIARAQESAKPAGAP